MLAITLFCLSHPRTNSRGHSLWSLFNLGETIRWEAWAGLEVDLPKSYGRSRMDTVSRVSTGTSIHDPIALFHAIGYRNNSSSRE